MFNDGFMELCLKSNTCLGAVPNREMPLDNTANKRNVRGGTSCSMMIAYRCVMTVCDEPIVLGALLPIVYWTLMFL